MPRKRKTYLDMYGRYRELDREEKRVKLYSDCVGEISGYLEREGWTVEVTERTEYFNSLRVALSCSKNNMKVDIRCGAIGLSTSVSMHFKDGQTIERWEGCGEWSNPLFVCLMELDKLMGVYGEAYKKWWFRSEKLYE